MLITGENIEHRNLLQDIDRKCIRNASYYLRIAAIIPSGDAANKYDYDQPHKQMTLHPRQIACVVSKEIFSISEDEGVTALVTLRSSFTKQGLLALDVGLVDPGYKGPIGSVVINFSGNKVTLKEDDEFFRVVFFNHNPVPSENQPFDIGDYTQKKYLQERHSEIQKNFSSTFLGETQIPDEILEKVSNQLWGFFLKKNWFKILAVTIIITTLATLLISQILNRFVDDPISRIEAKIQQSIDTHFPKPKNESGTE